MFEEKHIEALAAQSLYEDLSDRDREVLEQGLQTYPEIAALHEEMKELLPKVANDEPQLDEDLLANVRAGIAFEKRSASNIAPLRMFALAAAAVVAVGFFTINLMPSNPADNSPLEVAASSPLAEALTEFKHAVDGGESAQAYKTLKKALASNPEDIHAPDAQLALADAAFDELNRFADAHRDYSRFRAEYPMALNLHPRRTEILRRCELLEETAGETYRPLELLAQARLRGIDALPELESLLATHAAMFVGEEAAFTLASVVRENQLLEGEAMGTALAAARDLCTEPSAQAQMDLVLGLYTADVLHDEERSKTYLQRAVSSDNARVARAARDRLAAWK